MQTQRCPPKSMTGIRAREMEACRKSFADKWPRWDSNPHIPEGIRNFKSRASADSATRPQKRTVGHVDRTLFVPALRAGGWTNLGNLRPTLNSRGVRHLCTCAATLRAYVSGCLSPPGDLRMESLIAKRTHVQCFGPCRSSPLRCRIDSARIEDQSRGSDRCDASWAELLVWG
jgi:hypothetical protein